MGHMLHEFSNKLHLSHLIEVISLSPCDELEVNNLLENLLFPFHK